MKWVLAAAAVVALGCHSGSSHPQGTIDALADTAGSNDGASPDAAVPADGWIAVAAAQQHTCALHGDGSLYCWGGNQVGQIGDGTTTERDAPVRIGTATWLAVASRIDHTCGIEADHTLWCWGLNKGDLGHVFPTGTYIVPDPAQVIGNWSMVATGDGFTCGLHDDATLWCFGGYYPWDSVEPFTPTQIGTATWQAISAGNRHVCGIQADGSLWCWGFADFGQAGPGGSTTPTRIGNDTWRRVSAGGWSTCAITSTGQLRCWGDNRYDELAATTPAMTSTQTAVLLGGQDLTDWTDVSVGTYYACARRTDGSVWCWGANQHGQLAQPSSVANATPTQLAGTWRTVTAGVEHTCAIAEDYSLWCVGADGFNELGDGGTSRRSPLKLTGSWTDLALLNATTCALDPSGAPSCVGQRGTAMLDGRQMTPVMATGTPWRVLGGRSETACGIASDQSLWCWTAGATPLHVGTDTWTAVSPGVHVCAIDTASAAYCWGGDSWGETGCNGTNTSTPAQVGTDTTWTAITVGSDHSCGINAAGAFCWGANYDAQLGNGTTSNSARTCTPTPVSGNLTFVSLAAGSGHTCGLLADGHAYCWGQNLSGQIGDGTTVDATTPVAIGARTWRQIAGGHQFTCGVALDGSLWCWGDNTRGELGDGTYDAHLVPTRVGTDTDWQQVSLGAYFACALKTDHSMWCWGANDDAQLGDETGWREQLVQVP